MRNSTFSILAISLFIFPKEKKKNYLTINILSINSPFYLNIILVFYYIFSLHKYDLFFLFSNLPNFNISLRESPIHKFSPNKITNQRLLNFHLRKKLQAIMSSFVIPSLTTNIGVSRKCFHLQREVEASNQTTLILSLIIHIVSCRLRLLRNWLWFYGNYVLELNRCHQLRVARVSHKTFHMVSTKIPWPFCFVEGERMM